jgi:hypothetical protein
VRSVELTSGLTRKKGTDDFFTMNHRIAKVDVFRNDKLLKSATLDTASRAMQAIEVNAEGGDFKLVVKETLPGTKKDWKEIVVSEFRVLGTPGKERSTPSDKLEVGVGSLDATVEQDTLMDLTDDMLPEGARGQFASVTALCAAFVPWAKAHAAEAIAESASWNDHEPAKNVLCKEQKVAALESASPPWTGVKAVRLEYAYTMRTHLVAVRPEGVQATPIYFDDANANGMGCPGVWERKGLERTFTENGWLIGVINGAGPLLFDDQGRPEGVVVQSGAAMCRVEDAKLTCKELNPQYGRGVSYTAPDKSEDWRETFHVSEQGEIARTRVR